MFCFLNFLTMLVYLPETLYLEQRPTIATLSQNGGDGIVPKKTWRDECRLFHKINRDVRFWKIFCRPFVLLAYPTILWASIMYGCALTWNVIMGATLAQLFQPP